MATSMIRSKFWSLRKKAPITQFIIRNITTKPYKIGQDWDPHPTYYILLPEVPIDTEETNAVMRTYREYPEYDKIKPSAIIAGTCKYAILAEVDMGKHIEKLRRTNMVKNFENVVEPLEIIFGRMVQAHKTARAMAYIKGVANIEYLKAYKRVTKQVEQVHRERWNRVFYEALKEVNQDRTNLNDYQKRILDYLLMYCESYGLGFDRAKQKGYDKLVEYVNHDKKQFAEHVQASMLEFTHSIDDISDISEMPRELLARLSKNPQNPSAGPWSVNLYADKYEPFMSYCKRRSQRKKVYMAMVQRGTGRGRNHLQKNTHILRTLRSYNRRCANLYGFKNAAQMHIEQNRMAGTLENLVGVIETFRSRLKDTSDTEVLEVENYAKEKGFGGDNLEMWDVPYWRRKHRDHLYPINELDVSSFYPYRDVLNKLFAFASEMFDVSFRECTSEVSAWHEDVEVYKVYDKSNPHIELGAVYIDPYIRAEKGMGCWTEAVRVRCNEYGTTPITHMSFDFDPPYHGVSTFLDYSDLEKILVGFGNMLQQLLTRVPSYDMSSQDLIDTDARNVCAEVMLYYFNSPNRLSYLSSPNPDQQQISDELVYTMLKRSNHMKTHDKMYELFMSAYDLEMHLSETNWKDARQKMWYDYMCIPLQNDDDHPCSMSDVFLNAPPAHVYCSHWAKMVASDIVEALEQAELESPEKFKSVCLRFRDTFLSSGAGIPSIEVFRRFRGRDPSDDALLKRFDQPLAYR